MSRKEVIKLLKLIKSTVYLGNRKFFDALEFAINYLNQPEQRWIPCSERLPDKPNIYTVTDNKGDVVRYVYYNNESSKKYWQRCAKAWMPSPEPYKEGINDYKNM